VRWGYALGSALPESTFPKPTDPKKTAHDRAVERRRFPALQSPPPVTSIARHAHRPAAPDGFDYEPACVPAGEATRGGTAGPRSKNPSPKKKNRKIGPLTPVTTLISTE